MIKLLYTIFTGISLLFVILYVLGAIEWYYIEACLIAVAVNSITSYSAFFLFKKSLGKSNSEFLLFNLGGMLFRLFFILVVLIVVIKFLNVDEYAFIFLFFIFYFTSLIFEVNYFRKRTKEPSKSK